MKRGKGSVDGRKETLPGHIHERIRGRWVGGEVKGNVELTEAGREY